MTSLSCFLLATSLIAATSLRAIAARPWFVHLLVAIIISVPLSVVYFGASAAALETMGRDPTLTGRTEVWHEVVGMAPNSLFGAGFESFWLGPRLAKIWELHWWHPNEAHNGYIEVFLNLGWTGVILLGIVVVAGYRNVVAALRQDSQGKGLRLAYFVAGVIFNFTESAFKALSPIWIFFLLAATAIPKDPKSPGGRPLAIDYADNPADCEPAGQVVGIGLHQEII